MVFFNSTDRKRFLLICVLAALALGILVRLPYFLTTDFVLGDGGFLVPMIAAIRKGHYLLPRFITYNTVQFPVAYPALGLYLDALSCDIFGIQPADYARWAPLILNLGTIAVVVLLAQKILKNREGVLFFALIFPLIPRSYEFLIMGGGVTRSLGCLLNVLALYYADAIHGRFRAKDIGLCLLFAGGAVASHMEFALDTLFLVALIIILHEPNWRGGLTAVFVTSGAVILASPWWATVLHYHGFGPFLDAKDTSEWTRNHFVRDLLELKIFWKHYGFFLGGLGALGFIFCLEQKQWLLPAWYLGAFILTPRQGPTAGSIPIALLAAVALTRIVKRSVKWLRPHVAFLDETALQSAAVVTAAVFLLAPLAYTSIRYYHTSPLAGLTKGERDAMDWIQSHMPTDAKFVTVSKPGYWQIDYYAEWFPVLTGRYSATTVQGYEWRPNLEYAKREAAVDRLKDFQGADQSRVPALVLWQYPDIPYVAIFDPPRRMIHLAYFLATKRYETVYNTDDCLVLKRLRLPPASPGSPARP